MQINKGDFQITNCFKEHPELKEKFDQLWKVLANVNNYLALRAPTKEEIEFGAQECETCCLLFPVLFHQKFTPTVTGKQHSFGFTFLFNSVLSIMRYGAGKNRGGKLIILTVRDCVEFW